MLIRFINCFSPLKKNYILNRSDIHNFTRILYWNYRTWRLCKLASWQKKQKNIRQIRVEWDKWD